MRLFYPRVYTSLILNSLIIFFVLCKVLYNLKQAPYSCFSRLSFKLLSLGLVGSMNDLSFFIVKSTHIKRFVLIYMDGILVTSLNIFYVQILITQLHLKKYPKRSWSIKFFRRHWVSYTFHSIILNQCHYITDHLYKTNMNDAKLVSSYSLFHKIIIIQWCFTFKSYILSYHNWISQYLFFIYPNISYVAGKVYQFMYSATINHLSVVKWILCYLKNTIHYSTLFTSYNNT